MCSLSFSLFNKINDDTNIGELKCAKFDPYPLHAFTLCGIFYPYSYSTQTHLFIEPQKKEVAAFFFILTLRTLCFFAVIFCPIRYKLLNQIRPISSHRIQMYLCVKVCHTCTRRKKKSNSESISGTNSRSACRKSAHRTGAG